VSHRGDAPDLSRAVELLTRSAQTLEQHRRVIAWDAADREQQ